MYFTVLYLCNRAECEYCCHWWGGPGRWTMQVEGVRYVLLRWVVELVLSGAAETLLDAGVGPQAHHGGEQLGRVRLRVLHAADHVTDHLRVGLQKTHKEGGETHGSVLLVRSSVSASCKTEEDSSCTQSENSSWKEKRWFWGEKKTPPNNKVHSGVRWNLTGMCGKFR